MNKAFPLPARCVPLLTGTALFLMAGIARPADATAVFNEVMYHPAAAAAPEWIELRNVLSVNLDLSGWSITGGVNFVFPEGTVLPSGGFLTVSGTAGDPPTALGPWTGSLANEGETVRLRNRNGGIVDELAYNDAGDWTVGADGSGSTLAKLRADTASADAASWRVCAQTGGTPGADNFPAPPAAPGLVLNEIAAAGAGFFVELRNAGAAAIELGGMILSSPDGGGSFVLPAGALAPGALQSYDAATLGFSPPASAKLFLFTPGQASVLDAKRLRSTGQARSADAAQWLVPTGPTPGSDNTIQLHDELVISEIHYHPRTVPAFRGEFADHVFADFGDTWRYEASGADLGVAWRQPAFDDTAWTIGTATFEGPAGQSYTTAVQNSSPVAWWRLGENPATGTAADSSAVSGAQNGTYSNTSAQAGLIAGDANGAVLFGSSSQVSGGGMAGVFANDWTIEAWFTHTTQAEWSGVFSNNGSPGFSGAPLMTFIENSTLLGINGAGITVSNVAVDLGGDHYGKKVYAVITKTGGNAAGTNTINVRAWVDGVEVPSSRGTSAWNLAPRDTWFIGRHWADVQQHHRGVIDEVAVYNRALSAAEITEHERSGRIAPGTSLPTGVTTTYFRRSFNFTGNPTQTEITLRSIVDDGAVFYLNGTEIARRNMPDGAVSHTTLASSPLGAATLSDPIVLPGTSLVQGVNVIAVELHQATPGDPDATFGMSFTARETLVAPTPERELDTEFVELHNRSASPVDLTGWSLDGDTSFAFPSGTTLAAGGFLAVAHNPFALRALHPGANPTGPLNGKLSNSGGRVMLRDAVGNPADTVTWFDRSPWPGAPDGGGATLERRDVKAASNSPATWTASDESARTGWQMYTYRGVAQPSPIGPDSQWREFVFGLLGDGEVLLDDISVLEDPDGTRIQMLQNTSFDSGLTSWRALGNHQGTVIAEPGAPGNQVLRLVATGGTDHDSDHVETTLAAGRSVVNGRTYEISFRARWVSGCPSLHTRLYFNRLPRTTTLTAPEAAGTPGAPNSRGFTNLGPSFTGLIHAPAVPAAAAPVTVSVVASDPDSMASATLRYSVNGGAWQSTAMTAAGEKFSAGIPGQSASAIVQFYVEAEDALAATATAPAGGATSRALYKVQDNRANLATLHNVRIVMTPADVTALHANANLMSNGYRGATVITNESDICYDAGVHLRGSPYGRPYDQFVSFTVSFPADRLFRGVHRRVIIDRSGRGPFGSPSPDEILVKHMASHAAGGLAGLQDDIIRVITPLVSHTNVALLSTDYSDDWLDRHFDGGSDSPLYKFDGIYYQNSTTDGNPESPKVVAAGPLAYGDITSYGTDPENYRWTFTPESADVQPGAERLMALGSAFGLSGSALEAATRPLMDVDQWARTFALQSLVGNNDFYTHNQPHNLKLYLRPDDNRFLAFQHDSDVCFQRATNASLIGTTGNLVKVFNLPANRRLYHGHLRDLCNTTFNPAYMAPWIAHYGAKAGKDFTAAQTYIAARRTHVLSQLPAAVPFAITTGGGANFTVNAAEATLEGSGWIDVREIRRADTGAALDVEWTGENTWRLNVALLNGANAITLQAFNHQGEQAGTDSITITSTLTAPLARDFLRITELHYHPAPPAGAELAVSTDKNDFEFIELRNTGSGTLDISGCAFTAGVDFVFPANTTLTAGASIVVVRNVAAFQARYGNGPRIAGAYGPADALNNSGETITLVDATGALIQSFTFQDSWFPATDGDGRSMIVRTESAATSAWNSAAQWGISTQPGGTPAATNGSEVAWQFEGWRQTYFSPAELADPLISGPSAGVGGVSNDLRYALGLTPFESTSALLTGSISENSLTVNYRRRRNLLDVQFTLETTANFDTWTPLTAPSPVITDNGDGTETVTVTGPAPFPAGSRRFLHLRVAIQQAP
jgi:hypothetical protein